MDYKVYNNSITAIERAVKERVLFRKDGKGGFEPTPVTTREEFKTSIGTFEVDMKRLARYATPMDSMQFALSYQDRRRAVYIKAANDNKKFGFHNKLAIVKAFMKCEKYNFTSKIPVPRLIQPRDPRYLSETGRYIKPIEKNIYKNINKLFGYTVCYKGLNALQRGRNLRKLWDRFEDPVAVSLDCERFDQHVCPASLKTDHNIIKHFYPGDKHIQRLLRLQLNNTGKSRCADGYLKYQCCGRCSGDSNTSCGNVTICCAIIYGFKQNATFDFCLANDGDDCVFILNKRNLRSLQDTIGEHFAKANFRAILEAPVHDFEQISFCQTQPLFIHGSWMMVRDPRVAISKDLVSLKPLDNDSVKRMWLSAVGSGGLSLTRGVPVWQSFYHMFKRASNGAKPLVDATLEGGFFRLSEGMKLVDEAITPFARYTFWKAFGITPGEQIALENYYDEMNLLIGSVENRFAHLPLYGRDLPGYPVGVSN